uniref:Muscle M-line assembly protein unc-89 n=1 Tax=Lutzomyia longipalpis TaxID=7200 RepID=A0A1B0CWT0_LUTLO
ATIVWAKDEVELPPDERIQQVEHANGVCDLLIHAPSCKDSGTYSCTATNYKGSQRITHRTLVESQSATPVELQPRDETQKPKGRKLGKKKEKKESTGIPNARLSLVFQSRLTNRIVKEGQPVKLTCFVAGPEPNLKWLKNGAGFAPSPVLKITNSDGFAVAHFLNPTVDDSGEYSVVAKNSCSTITCSCTLEVYSAKLTADFPPMFTRALKDNYHINTDELVIDSHIRGQPMPRVSWMKDGLTVNPDGTFQQFEHEDGSIEFVISNPQRKHSGRYICQLENSMGKAELSHYVLFEGREVYETEPVHGVFHVDHQKIREKEEAERRAREAALQPIVVRRESAMAVEEEDTESPMRRTVSKTPSRLDKVLNDARTKLAFSAPLENRVCAVGSKVKLSCYVEGHNPHFEWFKNGSPVNYTTTVRNSSRDGLGVLEFFDAQTDDTGEYKCVVTNIAGQINTSATLMVYEDRKGVEVPSTFVIGLKDTYLFDTDEIILECHVRGNPKPKISWMREGNEIRDDRYKPVELDDGVCQLIITKPMPKDSGVFVCIAENNLKREQTGHYLVFEGRDAELAKLAPSPEPVKEPPKKKVGKKPKAKGAKEEAAPVEMKNRLSFVTHLADRTVPVGAKLKLFTICNGPEPQMKWTHNGIGVVVGPRVKNATKENNALIDILNVLPEDAGEWTCTAKNAFHAISTSCNITVFEPPPVDVIPPTFSRPISDTYNINVNELVLECRVRGQPRPTITWYKDGEELDTHMSKKYEQQDSYDGFCRLLIAKPSPADNGIYICKAENPGHSDQVKHTVEFTGKDQSIFERTHGFFHRDPNKPHFSTVLSDNLVPIGGTIGLQVEVHGPVEVQWLYGRDPVAPSDKVKTYAEEGVYTLAVSSATDKQSGTYTCRATNAFGKSDSIAHVHVIAPATVKGGKPPQILDRPPKEMVLKTGDNLQISFRILGDPKPQLVFMKGLRDLSKNTRTYKEVTDDYVRYTLESCLIQDSGTYCVMARNRFGVDRAFVGVTVETRQRSITPSREWGYEPITVDNTEVSYFKNPPEAIPAEPLVVDNGKNHVSLSWLKPPPSDAAPVIAYKVEAWLVGKDGGARWMELGVTPINSFDAFNLQQRCEYHFRVTPRNRYGWGPSVQTSHPVLVGVPTQMPEFTKILPGQLKALCMRDITLECIVKGYPKPEVLWYRDGIELDSGDRISCRMLGSVCKLSIANVVDSDSGRYTCEATNRAGRVSTFARLLVVSDPKIFEADNELKRNIESDPSLVGEMQPQFTMRLRDRRVQVTYPVRLTCQCVGLPPPEVAWFLDGKEVEQNDRFTMWNDGNFYTLEITRTTLDDGGRYTVTAKNTLGSVSCHCNLVVDKGIRAYIAPDFYCGLDPLYVFREGSEIRLSGQVEAYPSVGVTWLRDGAKLRPSRRILTTLDHNGFVELVIAEAKITDGGIYTCIASNAVGQTESCCRVSIEASTGDHEDKSTIPRLSEGDYPYSKEPMFITKPRSSEAYEGDTVIIHCEVIGDPKPDVVWLRDFLKPEYYKDAPHFHRVGDGPEYRLEIPRAKLDYTGTYSAIATNCHGEAKAIISLQIYAKDLDKLKNMDKGSIKHSNVETLPSFLSHLKDLRCCDGDAVTLECRVIGKPEPNIFWEKDGRLIQMGNDFSSKYDGEKATLSLAKVFPEDEGSYTCIASSTIGKTYSSAVLIVDVPEEKEHLLSKQLNRPPGILLSAQSTPRSTPRTTPIRTSSPYHMSYRSPCIDITSSKNLKFAAPKFYALPQNRVAEEGENVRFQCAIAGHPTPWATWDMNGTIVTPTARICIKEVDDLRVLEIEQVTQEDAGLYRITLENDFGRIEATARLDVICCRSRSSRPLRTASASPRRGGAWSRRLMGNSTAIGGRLALACEFRRGTSTPARKFYHNGEEVEETERIKILNENNCSTLIVDNVNTNDEGIYTCVAQTEDCIMATSKCVNFTENPVLSPVIVKPLTPDEAKDIRASEGFPIDLEVEVKCSEIFDYTWYRDDQVIPDSDDMRYIDHGDGLLVLRIEDPFVQDSGVYRCVITSSGGKCETSCPVFVTESVDESSDSPEMLKPHFSKPPLPVVSHPGAEVAFSARISPPQSRISWYLNGREIGQDPSAHFQIEEQEEGLSILRVFGLQHSHSGEIKCVAQTRADCGRKQDCVAIAYTTIAVLPEVPPSPCPAHILGGPQDCTALIGDRIVLEALFAGHPDPIVKWMRAGRVISETTNKTMKTTKGQSVLVLTDITADDSGKYTVEVTNEHGGDVASASVAVEGPPDPPGGRPSVSQGDDRVAVAWCGPPYDGGCMLTGFSLEMQENGGEWVEIAQVVDSLAHTVKDLTPGFRYKFRVRAENTHGKSEPSLPSDEILISTSDNSVEEKSPGEVEVVSGGDFKSRFEMLEELGKGRFGVVYKVIERETCRTLAAKVIKCIKAKDRVKVQEEIAIMQSLKHPKLLQLAATFETTKEIIMVMEYITGGELFERVVADDFTLTERDCILFLRQICEGVNYMHQKNSHQIKIIDFGLAQRLTDNTPVRVLFGTPEFIPPEIINYEPIGFQSDMWSGRVISETTNKTMKTTKGQSVLVLTDITADDSGKYTVEVTNEHGGDVASASVAVEGPPDPPGGRPSVSQGDDRVAVAWCGPPYDGGCMLTGFSP